MLNWWLGRSGEGTHDGTEDEEAPETPAPVFAVRALKSAVWGTPAPLEDSTILESQKTNEKEEFSKGTKDNTSAPLRAASPTKPAGILMTPGTGATRRKNVAFGTEVVDNEGKSAARKAVLKQEVNGWPSLEPLSRPSRKTPLTQTLENSRQRKETKLKPVKIKSDPEVHNLLNLDSDGDKREKPLGKQATSKVSISHRSDQDTSQQHLLCDDDEGDVTMDLNVPHSQSGKYWKSEYERYHDEATIQMQKLLTYKQLAKSYAKKKDAEATELAEKLKDEQRRITEMENKIARLSAEITADGPDQDSPELIKELARQTALAAQYRAQVEEFGIAMEDNRELGSQKGQKGLPATPPDQALLHAHQELRKARAQLKDAAPLREEMMHLRQTLAAAERTTLKLQEENTKLTRDLLHADLRLVKQEENLEKYRLMSEEQLRKTDEALQRSKKDNDLLREQMKDQRRDSEQLLKKRHEQVSALRKDLVSLKGADLSVREVRTTMEKKLAEHDSVVADYKKQIAELKERQQSTADRIDQKATVFTQAPDMNHQFGTLSKSRSSQDLYGHSRQFPLANQSIAQPSKAALNRRSATPSGSPVLKHRSSHSALSEITNNTNAHLERLAFQKADLVRVTPLTRRSEDPTLEEPNMDLPSPEPSMFSHSIRPKPKYERFQDSPRPSMFNITSSPPKPAMVRSRSSDKLLSQRSTGDFDSKSKVDMALSRRSRMDGSSMLSSKGRSTLPPERAAAARARLAQKNAEKKRVQQSKLGKENIR